MPRGIYPRKKAKAGTRLVRPAFVQLDWMATTEVCITLLQSDSEDGKTFARAELRKMARVLHYLQSEMNKPSKVKPVKLQPGSKKGGKKK